MDVFSAFLSFLRGGRVIVFRGKPHAVVINECRSEKPSGTVKSPIVHLHVIPTQFLVFTLDHPAAAAAFAAAAARWRCGFVFFRKVPPAPKRDTRRLGSKTAAFT